MLQIMMNASHVLIKSCVAVHYAVSLYNIARENLSSVNPLQCLED